MSKPKALILGVAGQDGSYLAEHLLQTGYEVEDQIKTYYGDVTDIQSIANVISRSKPNFIYNLAAQSHVRISFDIPEYTAETNGMSVLKILEVIRQQDPAIRYYQASSSEMFGSSVDSDGFQRETTSMTPVSPYGCAKLFAYSAVRNYRNAYGLFATNGILFNHESPRRASNFVTTKVVKTAVAIKLGLESRLVLGNLDSYRDWGHSRDYVRAMQLMMDLPHPGDYVVATGTTHSVRELCQIVFSKLGMNYEKYIVQDPRFMRPEELQYLRGDASRFKAVVDWQPEITFEQMLDEMIEIWLNRFSE
jgi:GDPmannose 4,6-dehydratase